MRKLLLICVVLCSALGWAGTCGNGYTFNRQLIIQSAVGSDQTNFPVRITGNTATQALQTAMLATGSGGSVTHTAANGISRTGAADVVFCDAASGGNPLNYELAYYDGTTLGAWEAWVSIPTLHTASNDSIWIFVGNNSVSTTQQDAGLGDCSTNFWVTAGYKFVVHFPNGATLDAKESACNLTATISSATATSGVIDGAVSVTGGTYVSYPVSTNVTTNLTMSGWFNPPTTAQAAVMFENGNGSNGYNLAVISSGCSSAQQVNVVLEGITCGGVSAPGTIDGYYNHFALTRGASTWTLWQNGSSVGTGSTNPNVPTTRTIIGCTGSLGSCAQTTVDEARIATVAKTQNWLQTEVSNYTDQTSHYITVEPTGPYVRQITSCATVSASVSCTATMPFPVTVGNKIVEFSARNNGGTGLDCTTALGSSSPSVTLTSNITSHFNGHLDDYYTCIFSGPTASAGAQTLTVPTGESGTVFMEVARVTTSGVVTTSSSTEPPATLTASATSNNSLLTCMAWNVAGAITEPYVNFHSRLSNIGGHTPSSFAVYGVVNSGSQTCTYNGGDGASMAIFTKSITSHPRPAQVY
jgi:hypothetical protein